MLCQNSPPDSSIVPILSRQLRETTQQKDVLDFPNIPEVDVRFSL